MATNKGMEPATLILGNMSYVITAYFHSKDKSYVAAANAHMQREDNHDAVIYDDPDRHYVYLVDRDDMGTPVDKK